MISTLSIYLSTLSCIVLYERYYTNKVYYYLHPVIQGTNDMATLMMRHSLKRTDTSYRGWRAEHQQGCFALPVSGGSCQRRRPASPPPPSSSSWSAAWAARCLWALSCSAASSCPGRPTRGSRSQGAQRADCLRRSGESGGVLL